jgi:hypothetical protein
MPRGLAKVLTRIRALAAREKVRFTLKALRELAALGLDVRDARETLEALRAVDFAERLVSAVTGERMYVFKPRVGETAVYIKLILRDDCIVVSFHEDENGNEEESA